MPGDPGFAWWTVSRLDGDGDRIDDSLADAPPILRVLVDYEAPPSAAEKRALEILGATVLEEYRVVPTLLVETPRTLLPAIAAAPGVVFVEADRPMWPLLDESRPLVRGDGAIRNGGASGRGVAVAVLDSGIDGTHPDLQRKVIASYDATAPRSPSPPLPGSGVPVVPEYTGGHGTHVAGIVAGTGTQSRGRYMGIAPGASIVNVKVFDRTTDGSASRVLSGIDWVLDRKDEYGIRVMQMSLGGEPTDGTDAVSRAINVATARGVLTVAAAGNHGPDERSVRVPGVAARALTVGAVDKSLRIASFSSRGPTLDDRAKPDLSAPGVQITSTLPVTAGRGDHYGALTGTSMASPHAAGAAALLFEVNPRLSPEMAKWILLATSAGAGPQPHRWDAGYGWGLLNVEAAVRVARDPVLLSKSPYFDKARAIPLDGDVGRLEMLGYEANIVAREMPAAPLLAILLVALVAGAVGKRQRL
ncbi:MAG: S8 family peptidase [Methanobacteriota archaeon]